MPVRSWFFGAAKVTPASLKHIQALPLEYLQLGEGFDKSESLPMIAGIKTLKRLTLTNCRATTDDDLKHLAAMKQFESLELGSPLLPKFHRMFGNYHRQTEAPDTSAYRFRFRTASLASPTDDGTLTGRRGLLRLRLLPRLDGSGE